MLKYTDKENKDIIQKYRKILNEIKMMMLIMLLVLI